MMLVDRQTVSRIIRDDPRLVDRAVRRGYTSLVDAKSVNPESMFLRFPNDPRNRIIALPAYYDGGEGDRVAGLKWVASFPGNVGLGFDRANAVIILSDVETGAPVALVEGSEISLRRTAASALIAASCLGFDLENKTLGLVGCGALARSLLSELHDTGVVPSRLLVSDLDASRATEFLRYAERTGARARVCTTPEVLARSDVMAFATSAGAPWADEGDLPSDARLILHLSLRDLPPSYLFRVINVADQVHHAIRERTSLGLAVELGLPVGRVLELPSLMAYERPWLADEVQSGLPVVFAPFGMGVLDIAVAHSVYVAARHLQIGTRWESDHA